MKINNPNLVNVDENGNLIPQTKIQKYLLGASQDGIHVTKFLTSDGLSKSETNDFVFNTIRSVVVYYQTDQDMNVSIMLYNWSYNTVTGELVGTLAHIVSTELILSLTVFGD